MNDWLEQLTHWLQQAWVYIPAILSFITAIGLPSLIQIAKIFASAKLYLTQTKTLLGKLNAVINVVNQLIDIVKSLRGDIETFLEDEIEFSKQQLSNEVNVKKKNVLKNHIKYLQDKLDKVQSIETVDYLKEISKDQLEDNKKKIKIKVKEE